MKETFYQVSKTLEFREWFEGESERTQAQIYARIDKIVEHDHFGDHRSVSNYEKGVLKNAVWELRWKDGRRVYYAYFPEKKILLLLGGNKNGQDKDIFKAKVIYRKTIRITPKKT